MFQTKVKLFCLLYFIYAVVVLSVTRLGDLAPIGRQFKLTGSFLIFRGAQFVGLQIGRCLEIPNYVIIWWFLWTNQYKFGKIVTHIEMYFKVWKKNLKEFQNFYHMRLQICSKRVFNLCWCFQFGLQIGRFLKYIVRFLVQIIWSQRL